MMSPKTTELEFTYKKPGTDVWVLNFEDIPVDKKLVADQQIVYLGPNSAGGNHKHPRTEWFVGIGDLLFVWLDQDGAKHEIPMQPDGDLRLIEVPPYLPHVVMNKSKSNQAILYEMADAKLDDEESVKVL